MMPLTYLTEMKKGSRGSFSIRRLREGKRRSNRRKTKERLIERKIMVAVNNLSRK